MKRSVKAVPSLFLLLLLGLTIQAHPVLAATTASPDRINIKIQEASISTDDVNYVTIIQSPVGVDLDKINRPLFGSNSQVPAGSYNIVRLTITEISWHATWSESNPSPCDGAAEGETAGGVDLGGHTVFFFKTPAFGGNTLYHYLSEPPSSGHIGDGDHPFVLSTPISVLDNTITEVNLAIGVSRTLFCDGISFYNRTDAGNIAPQRVIIGPATGLGGIQGSYLDIVNDEIGITNAQSNSVSIFSRTAGGNISPLRLLKGPTTFLNNPYGIAHDPVHGEIYVANRSNHTVTVYDKSAAANAPPSRLINGFLTGLNNPTGIFMDPVHNEIVVANNGNDSVTVYHRTASENAVPLRTLGRNLVVSADNYVLRLTENQGIGSVKVKAAIAAGTYRSPVELSAAVEDALESAVTPGTEFDVGYDFNLGRFVVIVTALAPGIASVSFHWDDPITTAEGLLGFAPIDSGEIFAGLSVVSDFGDPTRLNSPCGLFIDTVNDELYVTNSGNNTVAVYLRTDSGEISPSRILEGDSTGLQNPCGIFVDTVHDEIFITNRDNKSLTVYNRSAAGNSAPIRTVTGLETGLNSLGGVSLDSAHDEIIVSGAGRQVVMTGLPGIFPSSGNPAASGASLSGDYNIVRYGVEFKGVNHLGDLIPLVFSERGTASFDPTSTWPSFGFRLDTQIARQVIERDCIVNRDVGVDRFGFYGMNGDGTFYAFMPDVQGSLHGAFLSDGSAFIASMIDNSEQLQVIYGTKKTSTAPYLTSDGSSAGGQANYAVTSYYHGPFLIYRPLDDDILEYGLEVGMAQSNSAMILAKSVDINRIGIGNPSGQFGDPGSGGPSLRPEFLRSEAYTSHPEGFFETETSGFAGATTADGGIFAFMRNILRQDDYQCSTDIGFGSGLRQSPSGTFTTGSVEGKYTLAGFGDRFDTATETSQYRSTLISIILDGRGGAEMTWFENEKGTLSSDHVVFNYQVSPRPIPSEGDASLSVDVIDFFKRPEMGPFASALIGPGGKTLAFFESLSPGGSANLTRLVGLALRQQL